MKVKIPLLIICLAFLVSCIDSSKDKKTTSTGEYTMDRTVLPIHPPEVEAITEICPNVDGRLITHNMFLDEFVANGVFGLVLLITIFGYLFLRARWCHLQGLEHKADPF